MYQQYRQPQKRSGKGVRVIAILFIIAILGGGLWYLSKLWQKVEQINPELPTNTTGWITSNRYVGRRVSLSGNISAVSSTSYTHTLIVDEDNQINIFSSSRDLNNYNGFVYIEWVVAKYEWWSYIVDVSAIGSSQEDLETINLPSSNQTRILPEIGLKIDLTNRTDITYNTVENTINLSAEGFSGTTKVEWFRCEPWTAWRDCDALSKEFSWGSFVSAWGMTYSKWENGKRFAFNNAWVWYRVSTESDAMLYKVSSALVPINENYAKTFLSQAQKLCTSLSTVTQNTVQKNSLVEWNIILEGKATNGSPSSCSVLIKFSQTWEALTLDKQSSTSSTTTWGATPTTPSTTLPANTWSVAPVVTTSGLTFTSTRGNYSIFYPSAKIAYNSVNVQEDLWIEKLNCYVRIDVKDYKDRDIAEIWPWVSIYECTSKESSASLSAKASWYIFKTSNDGTKLFFIKVQNAAWADFAKWIVIQ